jgi:hypothetical protein
MCSSCQSANDFPAFRRHSDLRRSGRSSGSAPIQGRVWRCFHTVITFSSFIRATTLVTAGSFRSVSQAPLHSCSLLSGRCLIPIPGLTFSLCSRHSSTTSRSSRRQMRSGQATLTPASLLTDHPTVSSSATSSAFSTGTAFAAFTTSSEGVSTERSRRRRFIFTTTPSEVFTSTICLPAVASSLPWSALASVLMEIGRATAITCLWFVNFTAIVAREASPLEDVGQVRSRWSVSHPSIPCRDELL